MTSNEASLAAPVPATPDAELAACYRAFRSTVGDWSVDGLNAERRRLVRKGAGRDDVDEQLLAAVNDALLARQEGTGR
jgi:hypothetical protein